MVTCMICRHAIDDGGHHANCPILIDELRAFRVLRQKEQQALQEAPRG